MCLIHSMNSGNLVSRWVGTISLPNHHKKCAVFSTVVGNIVNRGEIHWDNFVKRVQDIPKHNNLVKLEGICINQANLYMVHEHLTCSSLECLLTSNQSTQSENETLWNAEIASYLIDILEGLRILHSFWGICC
ncbi:hypothetical protein HOLleu_00910 [Holothuria leucospilota]|uniref:Serine-threonine/tyrosine-protein kinase catalytic domain-containing protein n=1 Tax=Holothuria leucospilota TaxID=206669 RepID=A0A9Q1HG43_HOLLE|nr:hypothetical protein HOLleu_00910 [Holothuria leucospilota]